MIGGAGDWAGGRAEAGEKNGNDGRAGIRSVADADADAAALRKHGPPAAAGCLFEGFCLMVVAEAGA